jgi:UDP-2,3-diacylglucosamine pyrophosphatase LpxH
MKKIKLVVSDFHVGAGLKDNSGKRNVLEDFHHTSKFDEFLEFYSTGKYAKYEVELIFNGDTFNYLQIPYKGKNHVVITESLSIFQTKQIIKGWPAFFESLKRFNSIEGKSLSFITGNHDPQLLWEGVRKTLREEIGGTINFHNLEYIFDGVHVEHGQQPETQNKFNPTKLFLYKGTPEPILNLPWGTQFCIEALTEIKKINPTTDKIKPFSKSLRWALFYDTKIFIKSTTRSLFYMFKSLLIPKRYAPFPFIKNLMIFLNISIFPKLDGYAKNLLKNDKLHTVILGHTHAHKYIQFGVEKEYFNTGTWINMISLNLYDFGTLECLTYAIIKYPRSLNRPVTKLKRWYGSWKIMEDLL